MTSSAATDKSYLKAQNCWACCALCTVHCRLERYNTDLVPSLDCENMDGCYSANCTLVEAGAVAADNDDVMRKLVVKAVQE